MFTYQLLFIRSEKRKIEQDQQELNKKTKMDAKGKQKADESSVTVTAPVTAPTPPS